jgi:putative ABC transport system substrate-binding protein
MVKRLDLLKEAMPRIATVGVVINPDNPSQPREFKEVVAAGTTVKIAARQFDARTREQIGDAFSAMAKSRVQAALIFDDSIFVAQAVEIAEHANRTRLPAIGTREFAEAGGLMGYDTNRLEAWRRAAVFIDKIFKGAKPGDLPIERATRFELVVNLKTAKALGIKIPNSILVRADKVIE